MRPSAMVMASPCANSSSCLAIASWAKLDPRTPLRPSDSRRLPTDSARRFLRIVLCASAKASGSIPSLNPETSSLSSPKAPKSMAPACAARLPNRERSVSKGERSRFCCASAPTSPLSCWERVCIPASAIRLASIPPSLPVGSRPPSLARRAFSSPKISVVRERSNAPPCRLNCNPGVVKEVSPVNVPPAGSERVGALPPPKAPPKVAPRPAPAAAPAGPPIRNPPTAPTPVKTFLGIIFVLDR